MLKTVAITMLALTASGLQRQGPRSTYPLKEERMILEHNVTLGEAVVRIEAESEEELDRIQVDRPNGERLFLLEAPDGRARGLSGFEIELQETTLASIVASYAEGTYDIRARTASGQLARGSANLSLELPRAPRLIYPYEGALVPSSKLVVYWHADPSVGSYRLQLEQGESDGLAIQLPPGKSSLQIPDGFLMRGTETQLELAAIGPTGNRTVVEVRFTTR
jgi:hypothetical protein